MLLLPRGKTVAWTADLDGDGSPEWILETSKVRAVFSTQDGGRWTEFTGKDINANFLPEQGTFAGSGPVDVHANGDTLEITGKNGKRTVRLIDSVLSVEQVSPLPRDGLSDNQNGSTSLIVERLSSGHSVYTLK